MTDKSRVAAVILAAGQSRRMAGIDKMLAPVGGRPLVRIAAEAAVGSSARPLVVVTGHRAADVEAALAGLPLSFVRNERYGEGMSTSLRAGLAALPRDAAGALVLLADMPRVDAAIIDRLIAAFTAAGEGAIVVPTHDGVRGNPVLWPARLFAALRAISGDIGGRHLLTAPGEAVVHVEIGPAVALDIDTADDLRAAGGGPPSA